MFSSKKEDGATEQEQIRADRLAKRLQDLQNHQLNQIGIVADKLASEQDPADEDDQFVKPEEAPDPSATKQKVPWPERLPPFHGTEKRPIPGEVMKYAKTEEGITAYKTSSILCDPQPFCRESLKKPKVQPCSAGASGTPGVYISNSTVDEDTTLHPKSEFKKQKAFSQVKKKNDGHTKTMRSPYQYVNFDHPDLGYTLMDYSKPFGTNPKSVAFTVDGKLRHVLPPMPKTYTRDFARTVQNERHLAMEDEALRLSRTACANLVHARGKSIQQLQLSPAHIHFGVVSLGSVARRKATLMNVSLERARFHVVIPPHPLRVVHKPHPLAAGMTTTLEIELAGKQRGDFVGEIEVKSEFNIMRLTCSAKIVDEKDSAEKEEVANALAFCEVSGDDLSTGPC